MKFGKFLVVPSLVMALAGTAVVPSATFAEENVSETDVQF